jgi:hypothetical protein
MYIKRRQFLQFASSTLATIGLSQWDITQQGDKYAKVLAQNTPRKLALLVGINDYPTSSLRGCVNDVQLQQELLIHRFGFNPKDILTVTNSQATRKGILTAFEEHLIKQAKPGDVVVFHFSGHGSQVSDKPSCDEIALKLSKECANSTLVPIDGQNQEGGVKQIMGHTLFLLMSALKTENVTVVLDSCHSGGGKRGNFLVRSVGNSNLYEPSSEELEYQRQWLKKLNISPQEFVDRRRKSIAKGVVIASAKREQYAVDANFSNFRAGAFSFLFTQYLWQQIGDESLKRAILNIGRSTKVYARGSKQIDQDPEFESNFSQKNATPPIYFTPLTTQSADAVVTKVNGDKVDLWLGGIDSQALEAFEKDAIFTVLDTKGGTPALVQLESREGLMGYGRLVNTTQSRPSSQLQPGILLQERLRSIPNDVTLKIGLDDTSLDNNALQQAKQALQSIKRIEVLPLGITEVQYIFGRMTEAKYQDLQKIKSPKLPDVGSLGLFLPMLNQIIPNSFGERNEAVNGAITRLQPKFKSLLAAKVVKQMLGNTSTSRVAVTTSMTVAGSTKILSETYPTRGVKKVSTETTRPAPKPVNSSDSNVPKLSLGTKIAFEVRNDESVPLYVSILVVDSSGDMAVVFPNDWSVSNDAALLDPGKRLVIPQTDVDDFVLTVSEPLGFSEALIVASTTPLRDSLKALKDIAKSRGLENTRTLVPVTEDQLLNIADTLLNDLDAGTRGGITAEGIKLPTGIRGVDTQKLAAMAIAFEVVGK